MNGRSAPLSRRKLLLRLGGLAVAATGATDRALALSESEQRARIAFRCRENEERLELAGLVGTDPALDSYLQSVMDRLYPDGAPTVRALKDVEANAFAVPTGHVYVHTGLLLRVRNEAELASILGHEGAHLRYDHIYKEVLQAKSIGLFGLALPLVGTMIGISSMAGFSRDKEREADRLGSERAIAAGYDPTAGVAVFNRMAAELAARKIKEPPYFYADHPRLKEREDSLRELTAGKPDGERHEAEYLAHTRAVQQVTLDAIHERKAGAVLVALLEEPGRTDTFSPYGDSYLGDGYRLRATAGDDERALAAYDRSVREHPDYPGAYAARARLRVTRDDHPGAIDDLETYLRLAPQAREAGFARQMLDHLKQEPAP